MTKAEILAAFDFAIAQRPDAGIQDMIVRAKGKLIADHNMRNDPERFKVIEEIEKVIKECVLEQVRSLEQRQELEWYT